MTDDPFLVAAREAIAASFEQIGRCVDGLDARGLNWQPVAGQETNSIAAITTHALGSIRTWICVIRELPLPPRIRDEEFLVSVADAAAFRASVESITSECLALIDGAEAIDWGAMRHRGARATPDLATDMTAAAALLHAIDHLREHVGQMMLTRQLLDLAVHGSRF